MIQQIKYFQEVVKQQSFSKAAEVCHISQSAISQQIKNLENNLGFPLFERSKRSFKFTPAGAYFYQKSLLFINDYEQMCKEARNIYNGQSEEILKIGYLKSYDGNEFKEALDLFNSMYSNISIQIKYGTHDEIYNLLKNDEVDFVFNDQRRVFSNEYNNEILGERYSYIEISKRNILSNLDSINIKDIKDLSYILISSKGQEKIEEEYYKEYIGLLGNITFVESLEEARMLIISNQGFLLHEGNIINNDQIKSISLYDENLNKMKHTYCCFYKKDCKNKYVELFVNILKDKFNH